MIGALWTGISGLAGQQTALDNESHNIANVNTVGYKASRISFADQIYQDKIGKGSKILDAEKLFTQGNTKVTGVSYDMALKGNGFFSVVNSSNNGTSEVYYTRAGNLRMGDNGTLQDSAGNEVQGWPMVPLDPDTDVISTNPNAKVFTSDYNKLISSKTISHSNYLETITAKATDYNKTAKADSETIFTGDGRKGQADKISDVEALVNDYITWLGKLQDDPEAISSSSTAQVTQIKFDGNTFKKESDTLTVTIDGIDIEQEFLQRTAVDGVDENGDGFAAGDAGYTDAHREADELAASRIATYKALADKISSETGLVAYTVEDGSTTGTYGAFESNDTFTKTTANASGTSAGQLNALLGMIEIRSLIPGKEFEITQVAETSGQTITQGQINNTASATAAVAGSGMGAVESSRDALARAITGNQRDVFTPADLDLGNATQLTGGPTGDDFDFEFVVYDKETKQNVSVGPINIVNRNTIDEIIADLEQGGTTADSNKQALFNKYFKAENINGNLVISTNDANYDVEYSTTITATNKTLSSTRTFDSTYEYQTFNHENFLPKPDVGKSYDFEIDINGTTISVPIAALTAAQITGTTETARMTQFAAIAQTEINTALAAVPLAANTVEAIVNSEGQLVLRTAVANSPLTVELRESGMDQTIERNPEYSGRKGAGAEFIEIVNRIDQTASQDSLQLKLDALGLSDSAFGEFRVDKSGVIYMKQDGAEFAIGQISIALFNNNRGLEAIGDNLYSKTNSSGEPIYNTNNERTAEIEGKSLELSEADLSESLVNLMVFQRAFEANAKTITTADSLLNTLINLKR